MTPTTFKASDTVTPDNDATWTASVRTKLMQDYRVEAPATDASRLALIWNQASELDVVSIGGDGFLHHLYRSATSASGWAAHTIAMESAGDVVVYTVAGGPDRLFALGSPGGKGFVLAELSRQSDGRYTPVSLGMALGDRSLSIAPCGTDIVAVTCNSPMGPLGDLVSGVLPRQVVFIAYLDGQGLHAEKVACVPHPTNSWPHLPLVTLRGGKLQAYRGVRDRSPAPNEHPASPSPDGDASAAYRIMDVEIVDLPALARVTDFAVVASGEGVLLLATDGSHVVHALHGAPDAAQPGRIVWAGAWASLALTGDARPSFGSVCAVQLADGRTRVLLHESVSRHLWITSWGGAELSKWGQAVNLGVGGTTFAASVSHREEMAFATGSAAHGIQAWTRTPSGDWRSENVHLGTGERIQMRKTWRTNVTLTDEQNAGLRGETIHLTSAQDATVTINGMSCVIGPDKRVETKTDGTGSFSVTSEITGSLHAPLLTVESARVPGGRLEVRPDRDLQAYLQVVTGRQLLDAIDPFSGVDILRGVHRTEVEADDTAAALREVGHLIGGAYASVHADGSHPVSAGRRMRLGGGTSLPPWRLDSSAMAGRSWRFGSEGGRLTFHRLTSAAANDAVTAARAAVPNDFLGIDWGSLWQSVEREVSDFIDVVFHEGEVVLTFVLNGVSHVATFVLETVEQIYDLVTAVLDIAGAQIGASVGWLMKEIGSVFGWDQIGRTRDRVKMMMRGAALRLPSAISDPLEWESQFRGDAEQARTAIQQWLAAIRTAAIGFDPFQSLIGPVPSMASLFDDLPKQGSVFPEGTWLLDKAIAALQELVGEVALPDIPGLTEAIAALVARAVEMGAKLATLVEELWTGSMQPWAVSLASFREDNIVRVLDLLATNVDDIINFVEGALHELLTILHLAWSNIPKVLAWFDREIYLPFVSAFYAQVIGSKLSAFDLLCLCIAVPVTILEASSDNRAIPELPVAFVVWAIGFGTFEAILFGSGLGRHPKMAVDVLQAILGGILVLDEPRWRVLGAVMLWTAVFDFLILAITPGRNLATALIGILAAALMFDWIHKHRDSGTSAAIAAAVVAGVSGVLSAVSTAIPTPYHEDVRVAAGYGVLQAVLAAVVTTLYGVDPELSRDGDVTGLTLATA